MKKTKGKVSLFPSLKDTANSIFMEFDEIVEHYIKNPTPQFKAFSQILRSATDKDSYKSLKLSLPLMVASGTFEKRENSGLVDYSNILILDFDFNDPTPEQIEDFRLKLVKYATPLHLYAIWKSPGHGIKAAMLHDNTDPSLHSELFESVKANLFPRTEELDSCSKALSQGCFLSYDPDIFINGDPDLEEFHFVPALERLPSPATAPKQRDAASISGPFIHTRRERFMNSLWQASVKDKTIADKIHKASDKANPGYFKDGNRHEEIKRRATYMCKDGVLFETALWSMQGKFGPGTRANFPLADIQGMVNSVYNLARQDFGKDRDAFVDKIKNRPPQKTAKP